MDVTPHGVLPRDSHEISLTVGEVHNLLILLRDLVKENLQTIFGEEMGGSGGPRPPYHIQCLRGPNASPGSNKHRMFRTYVNAYAQYAQGIVSTCREGKI